MSGGAGTGIIRPEDWSGFDAAGTHDNAGIFRAMGAQALESGGVIEFPAGHIATSASCVIPGRMMIRGQGEATEIICLPSFAASWEIAPRAVFINRNWAAGDELAGVTISDLRLTGPAGPLWGDAHFINFVNVSRVRIERVSSNGWGNCTALINCHDTSVSNCVAENVANCAFDHWGGTGALRVINNYATVAAGIAGSFGIMVTGLKTDGRPAMSGEALILGNQITVVGGTDQQKLGSCIEINGGGDSAAALEHGLIIANNICSITNGATHRGIHLAQAVRGAVVRGNLLRGGGFGPAITATGTAPLALPRDCLVSNNLITDWVPARSQGATIAWWGRKSSIINNRGSGVSYPFVNSGIDPSNHVDGNNT